VFYKRTKDIEIDCHFIREKLVSKEIGNEFVGYNGQVVDVLTKSLREPTIEFIYSKLCTYNWYAPALGWGVLEKVLNITLNSFIGKLLSVVPMSCTLLCS